MLIPFDPPIHRQIHTYTHTQGISLSYCFNAVHGDLVFVAEVCFSCFLDFYHEYWIGKYQHCGLRRRWGGEIHKINVQKKSEEVLYALLV